ncbi:MAG: phosphonate C-P lyase system protein PhnH [Geminicoccaceae bacterium]
MITQGFADPALDAQTIFRTVLDAMAHPGRIVTIGDVNAVMPVAPGLLDQAAYVVALTLLDFETSVWLDKRLATDRAAVDALRFHCGCPLVADPAHANFALIGDASKAPPLSDFHQGTPEYPDRSTTIVMKVRDLDGSSGCRLTGPGIKSEARLAIGGTPSDFWQQWSANQQQYPLGIDLILTAGDRIAALPRTIAAEV